MNHHQDEILMDPLELRSSTPFTKRQICTINSTVQVTETQREGERGWEFGVWLFLKLSNGREGGEKRTF